MKRKSITLTIDSQCDEYTKNLNLSKKVFDLEYTEISELRNVGFNQNENFIVNYSDSLINLIFLNEVNNEVFEYWEKQIVDFSKMLSSENSLLQTNFKTKDTQYKLLIN